MANMKYFAIKGHAETNYDAIRLCADKMLEEGYVNEKFGDNCIRREETLPTGMPSEIPVAMPHSEADGVVQSAICLLIPDQPVEFRRMDDDDVTIAAEAVFNLAIKEPGGHMDVLRHLMAIFYDSNVLRDLLETDIEEIPAKMQALIETEE